MTDTNTQTQELPADETPVSAGLAVITDNGTGQGLADAGADLAALTPEEQQLVAQYAAKVDVSNINAIVEYGAAAQRNVAAFSESTLSNVRNKDIGEIGDVLSGLVSQLKGFSDDGGKGILGLKKRVPRKLSALKAKYTTVEKNVDGIVKTLEKHQSSLLANTAMLDRMFEVNQSYCKELAIYILAGRQKLKECREEILPGLQKRAAETGSNEDTQAVNDFTNLMSRFEKKLHDLELTRAVAVQMAPQIRMIQNNDALMVEKIQTSLVNTIPLWKSQIVLALGLHNAEKAMQAQREVSDMTNKLLASNAEKLKTGSIEISKESERGIVDIETLDRTNRLLIETLEEVQAIQKDGSERRKSAETDLARIESELKGKLLELGGKNNPALPA